MPKIKTITHTFGDKRLELDIWYNDKNQFYIKGGLPLWALNVLGSEIVTELYSSPDNLDYAVRLFGENYTNAIKTKKKVIVYNINFGTNTIESLNLIGTKYNPSFGYRFKGHGFGFNYHICIQHTIESKRVIKELVPEFFTRGDLVESHHVYSVQYDEVVIDWTPEREQFFNDLKESTLIFCNKIKNFFGENDDEKLKAIDSGVKLLN